MTQNGRPPLPTGTVTFVFLDIERSTELLQEVGPAYPELLTQYRRLTEEAMVPGRGVIFGTEGDGLFLAFPEAGGAVRSAVEAQRFFSTATWPAGAEVRVRMGVHTGTPTVIGDDYTGLDVHRAARVMSAGWGGQILLSEVTRSLISDSGWICRDLGRFDMRGLKRPERLYQVEAAGLAVDFPPVRARRREVELPVILTSFVGREEDVQSVVAAFEGGARLVTLTGPGGIGKSRLAAAAAEVLDPRHPEGVSFVDVSSESDPERVPAAIAERIGVPTDPNNPPLEALIDHLGQFDMVIVLDGFERVADGATHIATILSRCPKLAFLVTSRVALRLGAERELRVEPLGWAHRGAGYDETLAAPAVRLFVDRVRTVRPDFELNPDNAAAIRDLVERLEGCPLSIELAAARARLLPPVAILERLGAVLDLSTTSAELPARQRSLRATIEWSHGLLSESEQRLFRRLGVFVDGWAIEAAEAIAGEDAPDVFLGLETLVAQSMITVEPDGRMGMGTAMREFSLEELASAGEEDQTRQLHAEHYERVVVENEPLLRGPRQRETVATLSRDWRNLRAAAAWALAAGKAQMAGSLYVRTWIVAWQGDNWFDAEAYTAQIMRISEQLDVPLRARALFVAAGTHMEMGDPETAVGFARRAIDLSASIADRDTEAWSRLMLAGSLTFADPLDQTARAEVEKAVELARSIDDPFLLGYSLSFHGAVATIHGELAIAKENQAEVLGIARILDNVPMMNQCRSQTAMTHLVEGDPVGARAALEAAAENLDRLRSFEGLALFLDSVSWLSFVEDDKVRAMTALGCADAIRGKVGLVRWAIVAAMLQAAGVAAEAENPSLADARHAGAEMSPQEAITYALEPHHELAGVA